MPEITSETKAKLFAQYLGKSLQFDDNEFVLASINLAGTINTHGWTFSAIDCKLILKPLSYITEAELLELVDVDFGEAANLLPDKIDAGNHVINEIRNGSGTFMAHQYLVSKGYDVPQYLLGGKTMHEAKLCIYITETIQK